MGYTDSKLRHKRLVCRLFVLWHNQRPIRACLQRLRWGSLSRCVKVPAWQRRNTAHNKSFAGLPHYLFTLRRCWKYLCSRSRFRRQRGWGAGTLVHEGHSPAVVYRDNEEKEKMMKQTKEVMRAWTSEVCNCRLSRWRRQSETTRSPNIGIGLLSDSDFRFLFHIQTVDLGFIMFIQSNQMMFLSTYKIIHQ